jgi:hypothetical protein
MKARFLRAAVFAMSASAVGLLALSPSRAADTGSSGSSSNPMGACCGQQPAADTSIPPANPSKTCGTGTHLEGTQCVNNNSSSR